MIQTQIIELAKKDGKRNLFIVLLIAMSIILTSLYLNYDHIWTRLNIPMCPPHFMDSNVIATAAESHSLGHNPLYYNPQHPKNKVLNYPRLWHSLSYVGFSQNYTDFMGYILIILYFAGAGIFLFPIKFNNVMAFFLALVILSPAALLALERGNPETFIFFLLAVGLIISSSLTALFFFLFAAALKIFPIFGIGYLLRENRRKFWSLFALGSGIFMAYVLYTLKDIQQVFHSTTEAMHGVNSSFGAKVISKAIALGPLNFFNISDSGIMLIQTLSYLLAFFLFITVLIISTRNYQANSLFTNGQYLDAFRVGTGVFISAFMMGHSNDYRLMFLVFTIPQLVSWSFNKEKGYSVFPLLILCAVVFSCWNYTVNRIVGLKIGFVLLETANWIAYSGLLYLFLASVPEWFHRYLHRPFSFIKSSDRQSIAD